MTQAQTSAPTAVTSAPAAAGTAELLPLLGAGFALVAVTSVGVIMFILRRPMPKACIVLDSRRRIPLTKSLVVGSRLWPSIQGVAATHAEIRQYDDKWIIELKDGPAMWVDGRPSRKNRLRDGAQVALGMNGGAGFRFYQADGSAIYKQ